MLKRIPLVILLAIQALGGGAVTLAHARDIVVAPPGVEASHDARCAILHDELRCALCHYASARVIAQHALVPPAPSAEHVHPVRARAVPAHASAVHVTTAARAPPTVLS